MKTSVLSNLPDYEKTYASFSWERVYQALDGLPENKVLNIAYQILS